MLSLSLRSLVTSAAGARPPPLACLQGQSAYAAWAAPGSLLLRTRVRPPPPPDITAPPAPSQPEVRCWRCCVPPHLGATEGKAPTRASKGTRAEGVFRATSYKYHHKDQRRSSQHRRGAHG